MTRKIIVNTTIRVDGRAYASADAMPPDIRRVYERALAWIDGGTYRGPLDISTGRSAGQGDGRSREDHADLAGATRPSEARAVPNTRIVFNGAEYSSVEDMPAETRAAYERVMAMLAADPTTPVPVAAQATQTVPVDLEAIRSVLAASAAGPTGRESTTWRLVIAGLVAAAVLTATFVRGW